MNSGIITKTYTEPPFCEKEILRYAGCKIADDATQELMQGCIKEAKCMLRYKVCYRELPLRTDDSYCDFDCFSLRSEKLAKNLNGCNRVIIFCATIGVGMDRLIAKYSRLSPAKAVMLQAIGAERIEALCDTFCEEIKRDKNANLRPRFSPGYGDLPLDAQRDIFAILDCSKRIAVFLNDSLLMSPSKSVTAFVGIDRCVEENTGNGGYSNKKTAFLEV